MNDQAAIAETFTIPPGLSRAAPAAPAAPASSPAPSPASSAARRIADGVFIVPVGNGDYGLVVAFRDFILAAEPSARVPVLTGIPADDRPGSSALSEEFIRQIHALVPNKPIRYVVPTHHHGDHAGGVRAFLAEGAAVITTPGNRAFFDDLARAKLAHNPDRFAAGHPPVRIETVNARRTISDGTQVVEIIPFDGNPHTEEMLVLHLPRAGILFQGDLFYYDGEQGFPDPNRVPIMRAFARWLQANALSPASIFGTHMAVPATMAHVRRVLAGANAPPSPDSTTSSLIAGLIDDVRRGDSGAVERFWSNASRSGTPLIEPVPGEASQRLVTFLYRGDSTTRGAIAVTLQNDQLANTDYYPLARLYHVSGTSVWYRSYRLRSDARFSYRIGREDVHGTRAQVSDEAWQTRLALLQPDPLNARRTTGPDGPESVVELPDAPAQPWVASRPGVPHGTLTSFSHASAILGDTRTIQIYMPAGMRGRAAPTNLVVVLDGDEVPNDFPATTVLDNLMAAGRLAPTAAVFIGNAPGHRVRDLWYSADFARAIREEILPAARRHAALPACPARCAIAGRSLGGSAAAFLGSSLPGVFAGVIAQSGGFHYPERPRAAAQPADALLALDFPTNEWLAGKFAAAPARRQRYYLEVGLMEDVPYQARAIPAFGSPSLLVAHRHLRDVLTAKGYAVRYNEFNGNHRALNWIGTLSDGLTFVFPQKGARVATPR